MSELEPSTWYNVTLVDLRLGSQGFHLLLNNNSVPVSLESFSGIDLEVLNGPLFIGGYPALHTLEVCNASVQQL